jgi:aspartokinase/homoserine dehydrogenase 1
MSTWQVYKFGGSSLRARLPDVLRRIAEAERPLAVVVSALGDTTDWLLAAARAQVQGDSAGARAWLGRAEELAQAQAATVLPPAGQATFREALSGPLAEAERALQRIGAIASRGRAGPRSLGAAAAPEALSSPRPEAAAGDAASPALDAADLDQVPSAPAARHPGTPLPDPVALDTLLSVGERISATLVARALQAVGVPALTVDARDFLATDDRHGDATVFLTESAEQLDQSRQDWGERIPIVTGFIGRGPDGCTTTLGRNGSDYTATTLGALLGAQEVTIWTDVRGVMTADPALVDEAYPVSRLTWHEALELAHFGARMFHRRTVLPLETTGARLRIRSTAEGGEGTLIDEVGNPDPHRPTCVSSLEQLAMLSVELRRPAPEGPLGARVLGALEQAGLPVWMATQSGHGQSLAVVVSAANADRARGAIRSALAEAVASSEVELPPVRAPVSLVTLVAEAMGHWPNVSGRFFSALGNVGINVRASAQGASSRSISCVVDASDTREAVRTVHAAFNLAETEVNVLLLGRGTVGGNFLEQLESTRESLRQRERVALRLFGVVDQHGVHIEPRGLAVSALPPRSRLLVGRPPDLLPSLDQLSRRSIPVLVDCTAADRMEEIYLEAFRRGIHVVSANKQPLAVPWSARQRVEDAARTHFRTWHYETTVGAGLPVIETLKNLVSTGDLVERIDGSLSGTLGFLCQEVMAGSPLSVAVRTARDRGYTEPHPRDDLSGLDVARKALILARELGLPLELADVAVEPFVDASLLSEDDPERFLDRLAAHDEAFAARVQRYAASGRTLRYLVQILPHAEGRKVRVGPVAVERDHPAVPLRGAEALVAFTTSRYRDYPLIVRGAGAGGDVTAAGVLADVLRLTQNVRGRR